MILFKEKMGTCTTKHAVIATLAAELGLPITRGVGIYAMTEAIVTGTDKILAEYGLPYVPMIHCFLEYGNYRVDLTEGNRNGKNRPIDDFLYTDRVDGDHFRQGRIHDLPQSPERGHPETPGAERRRHQAHPARAGRGLKLLKANLH
ncbi:MAG: hypothetical protein MZV70_74685 [Desulfobacterales bacterium]|nr:hypothetical protein [Desulfobacterales bacterium]